MTPESEFELAKTDSGSGPVNVIRPWTADEDEEDVVVKKAEERARISALARQIRVRLRQARLRMDRTPEDDDVEDILLYPPSHSASPFASFGSSSLFSRRFNDQSMTNLSHTHHTITLPRKRRKPMPSHRKPSPFDHHPHAIQGSSRRLDRASTMIDSAIMPPPSFLPRRHSTDGTSASRAAAEQAINLLALAASSQTPSKTGVSIPSSSVRGTTPGSYDAFWSLHSLANVAGSQRPST